MQIEVGDRALVLSLGFSIADISNRVPVCRIIQEPTPWFSGLVVMSVAALVGKDNGVIACGSFFDRGYFMNVASCFKFVCCWMLCLDDQEKVVVGRWFSSIN